MRRVTSCLCVLLLVGCGPALEPQTVSAGRVCTPSTSDTPLEEQELAVDMGVSLRLGCEDDLLSSECEATEEDGALRVTASATWVVGPADCSAYDDQLSIVVECTVPTGAHGLPVIHDGETTPWSDLPPC